MADPLQKSTTPSPTSIKQRARNNATQFGQVFGNVVIRAIDKHRWLFYSLLTLTVLGLSVVVWCFLLLGDRAGLVAAPRWPVDIQISILSEDLPLPSPDPAPPLASPDPAPLPSETPTITVAPQPSATPALICTIQGDKVGFRDGPYPGDGSNIISRLADGTSVTASARNRDGDWIKVSVNGKEGWVSATFAGCGNVDQLPPDAGLPQLTPAPPTQTPEPTSSPSAAGEQSASGCIVTITSRIVALYSEPDIFSRELVKVKRGTYTVLAYTDDLLWFQIEVEGRIGWVENDTFTINEKTSGCP